MKKPTTVTTAADIIDGEPTEETSTWMLLPDDSYIDQGDYEWAISFESKPGDEPAGISLDDLREAYVVISEDGRAVAA